MVPLRFALLLLAHVIVLVIIPNSYAQGDDGNNTDKGIVKHVSPNPHRLPIRAPQPEAPMEPKTVCSTFPVTRRDIRGIQKQYDFIPFTRAVFALDNSEGWKDRCNADEINKYISEYCVLVALKRGKPLVEIIPGKRVCMAVFHTVSDIRCAFDALECVGEGEAFVPKECTWYDETERG